MNETLVEIKNVDFSYGAVPLLENVNFVIKNNDFIGIIGANGSGKTTLVKLVTGELLPCSGTVINHCKGSIGYLPQYAAIDKHFPISVREVVETGLITPRNVWRMRLTADESRQVDAVMQQMELTAVAGMSIGELSGGQLQRAMLARAIVSRPRLLLLDEPETYLDTDSGQRLLQLLKKINDHCAVVIVSHDVATIEKYCNRVARIRRRLEELPLLK